MADLSVSRIIYEAWMNTDKPLIYQTADAKGNRIDRSVTFSNPRDHPNHEEHTGICTVCGQPMESGIPVRKVLGPSYMDWAIHKAPEESHVCDACAFCLTMNPEGRTALFRFPLVAERTLHLCNRSQMRDWLLSPPEPPFVMIFPTSQKKHLFTKARTSLSRERFYCNYEERILPVDARFATALHTIEALRALGVNKSMIDSDTIPFPFLRQYGAQACERALGMIRQAKSCEAYPLALEVAQKASEEDARCFMDL